MDSLRPGRHGTLLPAGEWVLRLAVCSKDIRDTGRPSRKTFELSSEDRRGTTPRLSVWAERLTTPYQAWSLLGARPDYQLLLRLNTDVIRSLRPEPDSPAVPGLDVVWEPLMTQDETGTSCPTFAPAPKATPGSQDWREATE